MVSEFLEIARYPNEFEAELIRGILDEHGIASFLDGSMTSVTLSIASSAVGGVKLFVRAADAVQARDIIDRLVDETEDGGESWYCGACEEEVDGSFEVCWSCGAQRDEVSAEPGATVTEKSFAATARDKTFDLSEEERMNPYASPRTTNDPLPKLDFEINQETEAILQRAWRASLIGLVFIPVLMHIYSSYLLINACALNEPFSIKGRRWFIQAVILNVMVLSFWAVLIVLAYTS